MVVRIARDFGGARIDTADWPIVLFEFPERRIADASLHDALGYIEQLLRDGEKLGEKSFQITDFTRMQEIGPASQRKYAADWMKRTVALQRVASVGAANVTPSAILRGLVTAVHWFQPPPTPTLFVATRKEAFAQAIKLLDAAKALPPSLRTKLAARQTT